MLFSSLHPHYLEEFFFLLYTLVQQLLLGTITMATIPTEKTMVTYLCFAAYNLHLWGFFHVINGRASHTTALDSKQNHAFRVRASLRACTCGV